VPHVDRPGARLWWDAQGDGPPLLLIQGLGYSIEGWWRVLPPLAKQHRVIVFDNRGVGRSEVDDYDFTIEQMADDALAVLRAAGERSAHVIGASLGGIIAQELALRSPQALRSLVLGCTSPGGTDAIPSDAGQGFLQARADMSAREAAEASIPFVYAERTPLALAHEDIERRMTVPTTREGYGGQLGAVLRYAGTMSRLGSLRVPTLVVHGTVDRLVPPQNAELLARAIPGARLVWFDGAGHIITTDAAEELVESVTDFVRENEPHA
jgi:pimeloyl-ACP methyl ester carboxylesterase